MTAQLPLWGPSDAPAAQAGSDTAQAPRRRSEADSGAARGKAASSVGPPAILFDVDEAERAGDEPRADGAWWITHAVELAKNAKSTTAGGGFPAAGDLRGGSPTTAGLAGLPAGPLQSALLEQLDAGRLVSEQQLLEASLLDAGCRLRRQQHQVGVYRTRPAAIQPVSPTAVAAAHENSSRAFWAWHKRRTTGGDDG